MARMYFELIKANRFSGYTIDTVPEKYKDEVQALLDEKGLDGSGNPKEA